MPPEAPPAVEPGRIPAGRGRGLLLAGSLAVMLVGGLAWQLRPEAWRQRVETGLATMLERPVQVAKVGVVWPRRAPGDSAPRVLLLKIDGLSLPAQAHGRAWQVGEVELTLRRDVLAWWYAWRGQAQWPVEAIAFREMQSLPPATTLGDGYGRWSLARLELRGLQLSPDTPRAASVRFRGVWQRSEVVGAAPAIPVAGELQDVALSLPVQGAAPGLSMDWAQLDLGGLPLRLAAVVANADSTTFSLTLAPANLRRILPELGIAVPSTTDPITFTRVSGHADCHRDDAGVGCSGLVLQVDDTRLEGDAHQSASTKHRDLSPSPWQLRLAADRLDLDRYLPPEDPAEPPFEIPWTKADAWPIEAELTIADLRLAGLRLRHAEVTLLAGERGWETQ